MADKTTFIKLDRNITRWGWYQNPNVFRVFLHLIITANISPGTFMGEPINRGELATSYDSLAKSLGLTYNQVRLAIKKLESTGEIEVTRYKTFLKVAVYKYMYYQEANQQLYAKNIKKSEETSQKNAKKSQSKNSPQTIEIPSSKIPY